MTKTKEKIRDAEADKFINRLLGDCDYCDLNKSSFVSGFDCRDKMDNEALKIAVEALELNQEWYDEIYPDDIFIGGPNADDGVNRVVKLRTVNRKALAEIRKLRGEV